MGSAVIPEARITRLNREPVGSGDYVLYWMQAAVRSGQNHALEFAIRRANEAGLPLAIGFGIDPAYPEATPRTLQFLAEGLVDAAGRLKRRNLELTIRGGHPYDVARGLAEAAAAVVTERAYLREPRRWRRELGRSLDVAAWEIETNVVVPVEVASDKREYAARTIRPKLREHLDEYAVEVSTTAATESGAVLDSLPRAEAGALLERLDLPSDESVRYRGGESQARATLRRFVEDGLGRYADKASTAVDGDASSHLSMYLHYGHISPLEVLTKVRAAGRSTDQEEFIEELIVRRELAHNFVWFEPDYDSFRALPEWARKTLSEHRDDERSTIYTRREMEAAETDDRYWNAAMLEMKETGYLHNRMRMYWGKRIIEWTNTPEYAFRVALELNNKYLLDGRDPSSYANVGWLFGLHDQAFEERPVIGKIRPMTQSGLERKINASAYLDRVAEVTGEEIRGGTDDGAG